MLGVELLLSTVRMWRTTTVLRRQFFGRSALWSRLSILGLRRPIGTCQEAVRCSSPLNAHRVATAFPNLRLQLNQSTPTSAGFLQPRRSWESLTGSYL